MMRYIPTTILFIAIAYANCFASTTDAVNSDASSSWRNAWAIQDNFSISVDTEGYTLPTAIAFVPHPGPGPKDPLYYVTELAGKVKVVTNDRTVYTFAEELLNIAFKGTSKDLTIVGGEFAGEWEFGLAGICLEPEHGYVYITFGYHNKNNIGRNNVVRFSTKPNTFAVSPVEQIAFTDVFSPYDTGPSHQIGPCQVSNDYLYVSVGDGFKSPLGSQRIDNLQGKIIRMTLDGKPAPGNPYYKDDNISDASGFVWAYGLRNPFSLKAIDNRLFAADNGLEVDRFLEIERGENYLWNGNDWSIAAKSMYTFSPSLGPVQMDYLPTDSNIFPNEYRGQFFIALSGSMATKVKYPGILMIKYGLDERTLLSTPKYLIKYRSPAEQRVVGLAFGPDGLYFIPIFEVENGKSAILKLRYEPGAKSSASLMYTDDPLLLMKEKGCMGCHKLKTEFEIGGTLGPPLDRGDGPMIGGIEARLNSPGYLESSKKLDLLSEEPYNSYKNARDEVRSSSGLTQIRAWLKYHSLEPKFDNPYSAMPNMGLNDSEAVVIAEYLAPIKPHGISLWKEDLKKFLPEPSYKVMAASFVVGCIMGLTGIMSLWSLSRRRR